MLLAGGHAAAGTIDTRHLEGPWPKQRVREFEVGRWPVRWRQLAGRERGIFAGASFVAPAPLQTTWDLATEYDDLGGMAPGVTSMRITRHDEHRHAIDLTIKVLWRTLQLHFEVEQDPPRAVRFQVVNRLIGDYRGALFLAPTEGGTSAEVVTWLKPWRRVPQGLVLTVQRMVLLHGIREFLEACETASRASGSSEHRLIPRKG